MILLQSYGKYMMMKIDMIIEAVVKIVGKEYAKTPKILYIINSNKKTKIMFWQRVALLIWVACNFTSRLFISDLFHFPFL